MIVSLDEALDAEKPVASAEVEALVKQTTNLLVASESGTGFSHHYDVALQRDPDVVLAHAEVVKIRDRKNRDA